MWKNKIHKILDEVNVSSFDLYQLDGGSGFFRDSRIIRQLSKSGKPVICMYLGSDLRKRGVFPEINELSLCNFTVEYDHLDLYPEIHHIPLLWNFL